MKKKLVVVGNGMVAGRFLDELLERAANCFDITVICAEGHGSYNRIMLSSVLAGGASLVDIIQKTPSWYEERCINLIQNRKVVHLNRAGKTVHTDQGEELAYDHLVFATGSRSASIPANNASLKNIFPFRSINDTNQMLAAAKNVSCAVVVGGGFLGLEAAWGLAQAGVEVTLVHRGAWLLNRQLDRAAGDMLQATLAVRGLKFHMCSEVDSFIGDESVEGVLLKDGTRLHTGMVVIAAGITPNAEVGLQAGLQGKRAIAVDDVMQTSDDSISAIGECVEFEGKTFGLVDPLWRHATALAVRLAGNEEAYRFVDAPIATKLKISGINVYSAGLVEAPEGADEVLVKDHKNNIYRKLIIQAERIVGIVLYGDVRSGAWYFDLMQDRHNVKAMLPNLIFGDAYSASEDPVHAA